ncbi:MAG: hypothetical protein ACE5HT_04185 [Gemmatimonadales bacterium]
MKMRRPFLAATGLCLCSFTVVSSVAFTGVDHQRIPAFARKYRTSCTTCHTAPPKLNVLGEAFRLNGYKFPENDALLRRDEPVALGSAEWKDIWPRAIWPGELPGNVPIALRIVNDVNLTRQSDAESSSSLRFPEEVYVLAGTTLGDNLSAFLESEWTREDGLEVLQAKVELQNIIPGLPDRSLNVWVGVQNLYLFTFADRQIDRAGRQNFLWQEYRVSDLTLRGPLAGDSLRSTNTFQLRRPQPALEVNGLLAGRLYYGIGLSQGTASTRQDDNDRKDAYYKVRYKFGGLGLDGAYAAGAKPVLGGGGQLLDRTLIVEHFGYVGAQPAEGNVDDAHRSFGVSARGIVGPLDLGVGYVWGSNDNPWGTVLSGQVDFSSLFARMEYMFFPWFIGSIKFDDLDVNTPTTVQRSGFTAGGMDRTRLIPGVILLLRQNVRASLELELFTRDAASSELMQREPNNLWLRLDVSF